MRSLALIALLGMTGCEAAPQYEHVHASTLRLQVDGGTCSGFARKAQVIQTAGHCLSDATKQLTANGQVCNVRLIVKDKTDHALVRVSGCRFTKFARMGRTPKQGDQVFVWGNPGMFKDLLRFGSIAGYQYDEGQNALTTLVDINGFFGDSGAAIFNRRGQVVGQVSVGTFPYKLMGSYDWTFTRAQLKAAGI